MISQLMAQPLRHKFEGINMQRQYRQDLQTRCRALHQLRSAKHCLLHGLEHCTVCMLQSFHAVQCRKGRRPTKVRQHAWISQLQARYSKLLTLLSDSAAPVLLGTHVVGKTLVCFVQLCNQPNTELRLRTIVQISHSKHRCANEDQQVWCLVYLFYCTCSPTNLYA